VVAKSIQASFLQNVTFIVILVRGFGSHTHQVHNELLVNKKMKFKQPKISTEHKTYSNTKIEIKKALQRLCKT